MAAPGEKHIPKGYVPAYLQIEPGTKVECYFNPTDYSIAKSNTWNPKEVTGNTAPTLEFGGGQPRKMELTLLFDQTFPPYTMSVRDATAALLDAMDTPPGATSGSPTASPPFITFGWGKTVFKGACTSLTCTYKLFQPDGEPVRADVKLSLTQVGEPTKGQNPTTRASAGFGMHTVRDGDTLPSISFGAYGDATKWRLIAEANGVDNPLHLRRGSSLSLPALEG